LKKEFAYALEQELLEVFNRWVSISHNQLSLR
jgi:septum formation topological specificity factor MinE